VKVLYYDCFAGISGDMHLGALLDLGVEEARLRKELAKLPVGGYALRISRTTRRGIAGTRVEVDLDASHAHPHRRLADVAAIIEASGLSPTVKERSLGTFRRLAEAEAAVHGIPVAEVHFHEVGAVDAIVDIVGAGILLEALAPQRVLASTVELGSGVVECAHGRLPVPAPATEALMRGLPSRRGGVPFEATTPTGAAILGSVVNAFSDSPALTVERVGYGVGQRDGPLPNVLRVLLADAAPDLGATEEMTLLESNLDDMSPEIYEYVVDRLFERGAADVWLTPVIMKKGRPGTLVSVLCAPALAVDLTDLLLVETTTLGVRRQSVGRTTLPRQVREVATRFGPVPVKEASRAGERLKVKPEYEVCKRLARAHGVPIRVIYEEVYRQIHGDRGG
jgi:hypothetical protein